MSQALDEIHSTASRSDTLTTFNDFAVPPSPDLDREKARLSLEGGVSAIGGFYNRLKASVGPQIERSPTRTRKEVLRTSIDQSVPGGQSEGWISTSTSPVLKHKDVLDTSLDTAELDVGPPRSDGDLQKVQTITTPKVPVSIYPDNEHARPASSASAFTAASVDVESMGKENVPSSLSPPEMIRPLETPYDKTRQLSVSTKGPEWKPPTVAEPKDATMETMQPDIIDPSKNTTVKNDLEAAQGQQVSLVSPNETSLKSISRFSRDLRPLEPQLSRAVSSNGTESASDVSHAGMVNSKAAKVSVSTASQRNGQSDPNIGTQTPAPNALIYQMSQKILSRDFWLKDENAKSCFNCGDGFTTFRRKHHCRKSSKKIRLCLVLKHLGLCGQIYCSSCTSLISGRPFGQSSKLRVCKTCNAMLNEDDSSEYSDEEDAPSTPQIRQIRFSEAPRPSHSPERKGVERHGGIYKSPALSGSNITLRRTQEGRRPSIAGMDGLPALARPSSSRSLRTLGARPKSSSNRSRRPRSQHQHMRSLSIGPELTEIRPHDQRNESVDHSLPAFYTNTVLDPELEQFFSDDGSSDEDTPSISANLTADAQQSPSGGLHGIFNALRKSRPRTPLVSGKEILDRQATQEPDFTSASSLRGGQPRRQAGGRTLSMGSISHVGSSRIFTSDNLLKSSDNLYALIGRADPHAHSQLEQIQPHANLGDIGSIKHQPTTAELNTASISHLKQLLRQFIFDGSIGNPGRWEKALVPVLLQCAGNVDPNIHRGDNIDIRNYVKIKKISAGVPSDTTCVAGVVFTKTTALKDMSRMIRNPRILLVSFPLIYARHQQHFMSLEGVIAQEREYLRNLSTRIKALRPSVLLVQGDISGLMKGFLHESDIITVYNVKASVLQALARCTQTRIVSSVDKLTMDPRDLGKCGSFQVRTFLHRGVKKSFVYVSDCKRDLGCTIVLHGAEYKILKKLKPIIEFLCYVTYNLKLESSLMRDQFASVLTDQEDNVSSNSGGRAKGYVPKLPDMGGSYGAMALDLSKRLLSASPSVKFPQPYLLQRGNDQEIKMSQLQALQDSQGSQTPLLNGAEGEDQPTKFELVRPEMVYESATSTSKQVREILRAIHKAEYQKASHTYNSIRRRWEGYTADIIEPFSPLSHQKIFVLFSIITNPTSDACVGPDLLGLDYYQEDNIDEGCERDMPLGEYVERLCGQAHLTCTAGRCDRTMIDHHRQYVHGDGQVNIHIDKCPPRFKGLENTILMWSSCKLCDFETQVAPMSADTWKYSFAKYLELSFWNKSLHLRSGSCTHDIHREHVRCFGFKNMAIRINYEPINLVEIIVPRSTITWKVDKDLRLKNEQYQRIEGRIGRYMSSVKHRLKNIRLESVNADRLEGCKALVEELIKKANDNYESLSRQLQDEYMASRYYEIVPLNGAVRSLQEKVAEWDETFAELESEYFPSEKDLRRLAAIQFRKTFLEKDEPALPDEDAEIKSQAETGDSRTETINEKALGLLGEDDISRLVEHETGIEGFKPSGPDVASTTARDIQIVQTLDLAIPIPDIESSQPVVINQPPEVHSELTSVDPTGARTVASESPQPLGEKVIAKIQQMSPDLAHGAAGAAPETESSRTSFHKQPINAPPFFRSQTQPALQTQKTISSSLSRDQNSPRKEGFEAVARESMEESGFASVAPLSAASPAARAADRARHAAARLAKTAVQSMIPRPISSKKYDTKVSALAKHFEQMSREFEKEKLRERRLRNARTRQSRAFPAASANPILEVFRDANEAVHERDTSRETTVVEGPSEPAVVSPAQSAADRHQRPGEDLDGDNHKRDALLHQQENSVDESEENMLVKSYPGSTNEGVLSETDQGTVADSQDLDEDGEPAVGPPEARLEMAKHEKSSFLKLLASLWSERSASSWSSLDYPLGPTEHIFIDSDLIVREDEPSSLIAFALESSDYSSKIQRFRDQANRAEQARKDAGASMDPPSPSDEANVESVMLGKTATHMRYQFESGPARMQCKIFYAESFDAIRRKCGVAERFGESLSRCVKWDSKGGKTKSLFLKTLDERFVLKSLSQVETQAFLKFAPDYFDFMSKCLFHNLPSALAKMLGLYQVVIKNPVTGTEFNWFLQVMENVFYEGPSNRMFDLKGSMRNRKVQSTGEKDEVLLDENLLDYISQTPLYLRYHSNSVLAASISNDTLFCSKQNVMDYSLIVGLYEDRKELLVGIIDYIRTYTWDKKLETWIKDRGKHKATVRSPKEYRTRFRRSIPRYFPHAPSCWQSFGAPRLEQARAQLLEEEEEAEDEDEEQEQEEEEEAGDTEADGDADGGEAETRG